MSTLNLTHDGLVELGRLDRIDVVSAAATLFAQLPPTSVFASALRDQARVHHHGVRTIMLTGAQTIPWPALCIGVDAYNGDSRTFLLYEHPGAGWKYAIASYQSSSVSPSPGTKTSSSSISDSSGSSSP
ncbi:MAG: hypothetical protein H6815_00330 [Phycisphaeraceae bacterium]|nr:hypothetical protein [Phycisphaerales bacterium]MCB9858870.1 hypothetical protein [Phycisphaeraceae bacterium]